MNRFLIRFLLMVGLFCPPVSMAYANEEAVQEVYIAYYGRPADLGGLNFWVAELNANGGNLTGIINQFGTSPEYTSRFGGQDSMTLINNIYLSLFNRNADSGGLAFYVDRLDSNASTLAEIALQVLDGAQGVEDTTTLNNKLEVAKFFTAQAAADHFIYDSGVIAKAVAILESVTSGAVSIDTAKAGINTDLCGGSCPSDGDNGGASCPTSDRYIGNSDWPVTVTMSGNVELCHYPGVQFSVDFAAIRERKDRIKLTEGTYQLPDMSTTSPLSIPMCLSDNSVPGNPGAPAVAQESLLDFFNPTTVVRSFYTAGSQGLLLRINFPKDATQVAFGEIGKNFPEGLSADYPSTNLGDFSRFGNYQQCRLPANQSYRVEIQGVGSLLIEHHLWVGTGGAGFVAPVRVSGTWRGQAIDISDYEQMSVSYERHAFAASLHLMFDQPIGDEYGVSITPYLDPLNATATPQVSGLDAAGNAMTSFSGGTSVRQ